MGGVAGGLGTQTARAGVPPWALNGWRRFLAWRKHHPALIKGDLTLIDMPEPLVAFERAIAGERLLLVFNLGAAICVLPAPLMRPGLRPLDGHGFAHERVG